MSFYAGKYNGNTQCHITKGNTGTLTQMRGAPFSSTVFHTDIQYLTYDLYTSVTSYTRNLNYWSPYQYQLFYSSQRLISVPSAAVTKIKQGYAFMVLGNDDKPVNYISTNYASTSNIEKYGSILWLHNRVISGYVHFQLFVNEPTDDVDNWADGGEDDYKYIWLNSLTNTTDCKIIVFNFKYTGTFNQYPVKSGSEISLKSSQFKVAGIDLTALKYVNAKPTNSTDKRFYLNKGSTFQQVQLLNSTTPSGGLEIVSNNTKTEVSRGGKVILTTDDNGQKLSVKRANYKSGSKTTTSGSFKLNTYTVTTGNMCFVHFSTGAIAAGSTASMGDATYTHGFIFANGMDLCLNIVKSSGTTYYEVRLKTVSNQVYIYYTFAYYSATTTIKANFIELE